MCGGVGRTCDKWTPPGRTWIWLWAFNVYFTWCAFTNADWHVRDCSAGWLEDSFVFKKGSESIISGPIGKSQLILTASIVTLLWWTKPKVETLNLRGWKPGLWLAHSSLEVISFSSVHDLLASLITCWPTLYALETHEDQTHRLCTHADVVQTEETVKCWQRRTWMNAEHHVVKSLALDGTERFLFNLLLWEDELLQWRGQQPVHLLP